MVDVAIFDSMKDRMAGVLKSKILSEDDTRLILEIFDNIVIVDSSALPDWTTHSKMEQSMIYLQSKYLLEYQGKARSLESVKSTALLALPESDSKGHKLTVDQKKAMIVAESSNYTESKEQLDDIEFVRSTLDWIYKAVNNHLRALEQIEIRVRRDNASNQ